MMFSTSMNLWFMENTGTSLLLRSRRLGSFLSTSSGPGVRGTPKILVKKVGQTLRHDVCVGEDGWGSTLISCVRMATCFITVMVLTVIWAVIMVVLIPWPYERLSKEMFMDMLLMWILGNRVTIEGAKFSNKRAIYICNHASLLDVFLVMWLTPTGSVGIAKKEIIWHPLIGQLYVLANHLRIDRSNLTAAIESMKELEQLCDKLSLIIFPEGTRSRDGRLLPFKKGFVYLALQAGLPIVPMVLTGTHQAWRKGSLHVRPASLSVKYLPPIRTDGWTADKIDEHIKMVHDLYVQHLPQSQRPLVLEEFTNGTKS